ncbi:MAG: molecular chaperone HtpG [Planctomycetota bacterium]|jgi:molecular chaperone HtpG
MSTAADQTAESVPFQAETQELLHLVIHSLYTHEEIFLRELISNSSDALDKLRVEALQDGDLVVDENAQGIRLEVDSEARTLSVIDEGVGMSRDEVISNLGTIARSGTKAFLKDLKEKKSDSLADPELIGQFGVGFYASFMVASEVVVETRRVGEQNATRWRSDGVGGYTVEECSRDKHGTTVTLSLKTVAELGDGGVDFTDEAVLRQVVKRYSDFIEYAVELETGEGDDQSISVLNSRKPIWTRARSEVTPAEYNEFYRHLSHDWNEPFETIHFKAEGAAEYTALLFVPKQRPMDLFDPQGAHSRINLYVRRVFIQDDCEELCPAWMRFVRGVVDSSDLPLNVSRETLQHNRQIGQMKKRVVRKVLDALKKRLRDDRLAYGEFWSAFGSVLKEGIYHEDEQREDVARLALFHSTFVAPAEPSDISAEEGADEDSAAEKGSDGLTTLEDYVARMPDDQEAIHVLCASSIDVARRSAHLESLKAKGYEVLLLVDSVDEFVLQRLTEFAGKPLRQIDKGELDLDDAEEKEAREKQEQELEPVLKAVGTALEDHVGAVRFTARLTDSAACLVGGEGDLSPQLERFLRETGQPVPDSKRNLELNAGHPLVARLCSLSSEEDSEERFADACHVLLGMAHLAEGTAPPEPTRFNSIVGKLLE